MWQREKSESVVAAAVRAAQVVSAVVQDGRVVSEVVQDAGEVSAASVVHSRKTWA